MLGELNTTTANLQQDELQEMLGHPPGWILRSGIMLIFFVIAVALLLSWLIRYPDEIPAQMTIVQSTPPHELRPLATTRVDTILKEDGEPINTGDRIALLESAANWRHVDSLWQLLQDEKWDDLPKRLTLGNLQGQYAAFLEARKELQFFNERVIFQQRQVAAKEEIATLLQLETAHKGQRQFFLKEKQLIQKNMERTETLHNEGVSSAIELEEQQKQLLQYEQQLKGLEVTLLQNRLRIQQLQAQLSENLDEFQRSKNGLELKQEQACRHLKGALEEWYAQYILSSPIAGKVEWQGQIGGRYTVQAGSLLGMVVPKDKHGPVIAQLRLPATGMGKIAIGSPVNINLDAYPSQEYGQIAAKVDEISLVPIQNSDALPEYTIKVYLPDTLKTTYGKKLPIQPNMPGKATVITKDRRILERVFQQFMNVLKNN